MTAVWILAIIAGILALLLLSSICIRVSVTDEVNVTIGMFGIRYPLVPAKEEEEKTPKAKTKSAKKKAKKKSEKESHKANEKSFSETVDLVLCEVQAIVPGSKRLLSHLRFLGVEIDFRIAGEQADETAIRYGAVGAGIYNLLAAMKVMFTLKVKSVDVVPDFVGDESHYFVRFRAKLRLFWIVAALIEVWIALAKALQKRETPAESSAKKNTKEKSDKAVYQK